jgi:hypothetical protein
MKQLFILLAFVCAATGTIVAQSEFSTVTINKKVQPGLLLNLPNNTDVAEGTLLQKLKETGYTPETTGSMFWKKNKQDGFYVFNGVQLPALNNQKLDLYFRVEKNKSVKGSSIMYMLVSKGYDTFVSPELDSITFQAATAFLNGFLAGNASFSLQQEIEAQEKVVLNAEKKLGDLQDDEKSLLKKAEQLQANIMDNRSSREMQSKEITNQKAALEALKAKIVFR